MYTHSTESPQGAIHLGREAGSQTRTQAPTDHCGSQLEVCHVFALLQMDSPWVHTMVRCAWAIRVRPFATCLQPTAVGLHLLRNGGGTYAQGRSRSRVRWKLCTKRGGDGGGGFAEASEGGDCVADPSCPTVQPNPKTTRQQQGIQRCTDPVKAQGNGAHIIGTNSSQGEEPLVPLPRDGHSLVHGKQIGHHPHKDRIDGKQSTWVGTRGVHGVDKDSNRDTGGGYSRELASVGPQKRGVIQRVYSTQQTHRKQRKQTREMAATLHRPIGGGMNAMIVSRGQVQDDLEEAVPLFDTLLRNQQAGGICECVCVYRKGPHERDSEWSKQGGKKKWQEHPWVGHSPKGGTASEEEPSLCKVCSSACRPRN